MLGLREMKFPSELRRRRWNPLACLFVVIRITLSYFRICADTGKTYMFYSSRRHDCLWGVSHTWRYPFGIHPNRWTSWDMPTISSAVQKTSMDNGRTIMSIDVYALQDYFMNIVHKIEQLGSLVNG